MLAFIEIGLGSVRRVLVCSSRPWNRRIQWENGSTQQHMTISCLIDHILAIKGGLGGPLGGTANLPKPNLAGAYPDTCLSLPESGVWRSVSTSVLKA